MWENDSIMDPRTCTELHLDFKDLSASGAPYVPDIPKLAMPPASAWQRLPQLMTLSLRGTILPASGLQEVLAGCPRLTELSLELTKFGKCEGGLPAVMDQIAERESEIETEDQRESAHFEIERV